MTERLRVAVAGVGSFSQRVLIPGLLECPAPSWWPSTGRRRRRRRGSPRSSGVPYAGSDYERMLDEVRPQAVVVATPNDVHYPMALAALRRGMAVCCEKPWR